jgi:hypothetical protein
MTRPSHGRSISHISIKTITPSDLKGFLLPLSVLLGIAAASAAQTEVAHSLVVDQKYNQPYFTFFLTHITFALVCPIHLLVLSAVHRIPISTYLDDVRAVISNQLGEDHHTPWSGIAWRWTVKISGLTWLISIPAFMVRGYALHLGIRCDGHLRKFGILRILFLDATPQTTIKSNYAGQHLPGFLGGVGD